MHHAFVIEAPAEQGIEIAQNWIKENLGMSVAQNPDIVVLRYGLFSVTDARKVAEIASGGAFSGDTKVLIISASRAYHEAQNALLKVFEEPPQGVSLFLILPSVGGLLPTLRSRVQVFDTDRGGDEQGVSKIVEEFLKAGKEKRTTIIKKLASGKDDEDRREHREEAIAILDGIERVLYTKYKKSDEAVVALLSDISTLRPYLYDRSAPVRMILEHLSLTLPKDLV
jgi:hypothetical protein